MKILLFAHQLVISGTSVNAIELAAALRDLYGHNVVLFATPGPLAKLAEEKGLQLLPAPGASFQPSIARIRALRSAVRHETPDLLYVWDWKQALDAYYGVHLPMRVPMAVTSMSMVVDRMLPKVVPTTFGTPELVDQARAGGHGRVKLLLPPVDVDLNARDAVDPLFFRKQWNIKVGDITLVTVSRLDEWMKAESLFRIAEAVRTLGGEMPVRFLVVGDGSARARLEKRALEINSELGRSAMVFTGAMLDPRPAYAAADIVLSMGGSALRAMAFSKPVIIVGERGFCAALTPETAGSFYYKGIYGLGNGTASNAHLVADIRRLSESPELRAALGLFSRQFVVRHFSLETVCARLDEFCRDAVARVPWLPFVAADGLQNWSRVCERKEVSRAPLYNVTALADAIGTVLTDQTAATRFGELEGRSCTGALQ